METTKPWYALLPAAAISNRCRYRLTKLMCQTKMYLSKEEECMYERNKEHS